ncbi:MAG TPA: ATP-binding cassette domain-containing protein [Thermoplasmata archaeon]|nr:ATP-binding cassette domain-containing protein [Thermoplasmata archaeon]
MQPSSAPPVVVTQDLTRRFGQLTAVHPLRVSVQPGEIFGLIGPNGAGKTTTIKMLTTLLPPTAGTASVAGFDIVREPTEVRRNIGYVPQLISADAQITGYENLWVFARLYLIPPAERERRIRSALEFMGLSGVADELVKNYSGGMIRRLEIAQALMHRPRVLFMDEPTVGLDPIAREAVWEQIVRLRREYGTSVVLTTHYMEEADHLCERVGVLHRGRLVASGSPAELKAGLEQADASLEDVFVHYAGEEMELGGGYREAGRLRRVAVRLE